MAIERQVDPDGVQPAQTVLGRTYRRITLGVVMLVLVHATEAMSASTIMPKAAEELHGVAQYAWAFSGYTAASLPGMAAAGRLCDRYGPRVPYLTSAVLFVVSLLISGTSHSFTVFVLARMLQGFSAGLYIVTVYVVIARVYPAALRPRMFSLMPVSWAIASTLGPQLAGWIAEQWTWRASYLGVPPLIVIAAFIVIPALGGRPGSRSEASQADRLPLAAVMVAMGGVWGLQLGAQKLVLSSAILLPVSLAAVVVSVPRLLPKGALRFPSGGAGLIALRGVLSGSFIPANAFIPLMLVRERSLHVAVAGLALTAIATSWAVGAWYQGWPRKRHSHRQLLQLGCAAAMLGVVTQPLALISGVSPYVSIAMAGVGGLGMGLAVPSVSVLLFERTVVDHHGAYASQLQLSDSLGSVSSVALAGCLFAALHGAPGHSTGAFTAIFLIMGSLAATATVLTRRVTSLV